MKWVKALVIILAVVLVLIGSTFFIFGGDVLQEGFYEKIFTGEFFIPDNGEINGGEIYDGDGSGNGAGSEIIDGPIVNNATNESNCVLKRLSYSLRNFEENVTCQEFAGDDCISLYAICSVEIFNFDDDFAGDFEIRYTLTDSSENNFGSETLSKNVGAGGNELFSVDFEIGSNDGVDENSQCLFNMVSVPVKEVCS